MDAITLLKNDHKTVKALFARIDKLGDGSAQLPKLVEQVIKELSIHAAIEETLFYPAVRELVPDTEDDVLESLEEHHVVKWVLSELEHMEPSEERYQAKVTVLKELVLHHAQEEEQELFPMVRASMGRTALGDLGDRMAKAKKTAPTRPHPRTPDTPPLNVVLGNLAGVADRARDRGRATVRKAATTRKAGTTRRIAARKAIRSR